MFPNSSAFCDDEVLWIFCVMYQPIFNNKRTPMYVRMYAIFLCVECLYHFLTGSEDTCIQEEQPRLSEHMVRFTRFFRADSRLTVLFLSVVKVPYACAFSWGVTAESRFNRWPADPVFTFDGYRTLVFWQGGNKQYFRLRGLHVAADQEKQTYRPRKAPHRGWTFNEVTNSFYDKHTYTVNDMHWVVLRVTTLKKTNRVSATNNVLSKQNTSYFHIPYTSSCLFYIRFSIWTWIEKVSTAKACVCNDNWL